MKSVSQHSFAMVPKAEIPRSSFDMSHGHKTTFDGGWLVPIFCSEALPGDTWNLRMTTFARLATPVFPIMDNLHLDYFFFAVPHRLIWSNWEKFCGSQVDPGDSIDFSIPQVIPTPVAMDLWDYLGIPVSGNSIGVSALFSRSYNLIWNEWFRDQNLQDSIVNDVDDGPDTVSSYVLKRRGKRHDYFTSCLPWPQKGDSVDLPLGTAADVLTRDADILTATYPMRLAELDGTFPVAAEMVQHGVTGALIGDNTAVGTAQNLTFHPTNLYADLTDASAATINQLRQAFQIQKLLERDARGGTRYTEIIKSHFGVTSPDARLQRPEYLGGGSSPVVISPIAQTSEAGTTAQATLAAIGTSSGRNIGFTKSFTEHCVLLGFVSARADLTYQQGLPRQFSRLTRYDYFWPALAQIGEQSVLNKEIFYSNSGPVDTAAFGYQERYAEYRYSPSRLSGLFRSDVAGTLDAWHLSQDFAALPLLDDTFIQDTPPIDRVIAVSSEPHFIFDSYFDVRCARPMPMFGVPGLIDHF